MGSERFGERLGWIGGWIGSFVWLAIFAGVWAVRGRTGLAFAAAVLFALALVILFALTPWRFPATPFWKLSLPLYGLLGVAIALVLGAEWKAVKAEGVSPWNLLLLLPVLMPILSFGQRRWSDRGGLSSRP